MSRKKALTRYLMISGRIRKNIDLVSVNRDADHLGAETKDTVEYLYQEIMQKRKTESVVK